MLALLCSPVIAGAGLTIIVICCIVGLLGDN